MKRNDKVRLFLIDNNKFEVRNVGDDVLLDADSNYFIYMKNVNFKGGNVIEGRYLGNCDDSFIDSYCKPVVVSNDCFMVNNQKINTARMVAVNNKTNVIVIIEND